MRCGGDYLFHVTPASKLDSILRQGLVPGIGPRARMLGEPRPAVYFFTSLEALEDGLGNWLGEQFSEDEPLALLAVAASSITGLRVATQAGFEASAEAAVPAEALTVVTADLDGLADLGQGVRRVLEGG